MLLEAPVIPPLTLGSKLQSRGVFHSLFSFPVVMGALLVLLTVFTIRSRFSDPDTWFHLKIGEVIWKSHSIPSVDTFSFTAYGHARVPQEWLSQLTMFGAWKLGGYPGLMVWLCVSASLLIILSYLLCTLYSGNVKVAFLGGIMTWFFATVGFSIRPHILGYLLLICELLIVHLGQTRDRRFFLALPPLFGLWINLHSSFVLGLVVLSVVLFCSFLEFRWGLLVSERWEKPKRWALAAVLPFCIAALFLNPAGITLVRYPFDIMFNLPLSLHVVSEWLPPSFDNARPLTILAITALVLLLPLLRRVELRFQELLFLMLAFWFAIRHERMMFLFGILVAPIVCRLLADLWDGYDARRDFVLPNAIILALLLPSAGLTFPSSKNLDEQIRTANPVKALEFIRRTGLSGRMLNDYRYGGYLIWAAPEHKVFIDGRGDVFEWTGVMTEYNRVMTVQIDPKLFLDKYQINFCLLAKNTPITHILSILGWTEVYSDDSTVIFTSPLPRR